MSINSFCIEGIDRLGKDSLISGIKNKLGFHQEIHYQKPEILEVYANNLLKDAQKTYQSVSFYDMMTMLSHNDVRFIMNRAHLGEYVYSPRYRGYSGDYVFNLEKHFPKFLDNTLLVLLWTSSFLFIKDDGMSFDFNKKEDEQKDFINAFHLSNMKHKIMIDVHNGKGSFKSKEEILNIVLQSYKDIK